MSTRVTVVKAMNIPIGLFRPENLWQLSTGSKPRAGAPGLPRAACGSRVQSWRLDKSAELRSRMPRPHPQLTRISHGPVRNAQGVPTFVGVSRESFRPGKLLPKQLATGDQLRPAIETSETSRITSGFIKGRVIVPGMTTENLYWHPRSQEDAGH